MSALQPHILTQIATLHSLVEQFRQTLEQESRALAQWPPQGLWPVQEEKVRLVRDLEVAHDALNASLKAQGHDLQGVDTLPAAIAQRWQALRIDLAQCQRMNATNERCLAKQQQAVKQSLELLVLKLDQDMTYGRQGSCHGGRRLGKIGLA